VCVMGSPVIFLTGLFIYIIRKKFFGNEITKKELGRDMRARRHRLILITMTAVFILATLSGCGIDKNSQKKITDLDYTVCDERGLPHELMDIINDKKKEPCKFTYRTNDYLYIIVGYGAQDRKDLNVVVSSLYMTENAIYIETDLTTVDNDGLEKGLVSYPWIAVKVKNCDLQVNFK